MLVALDGTFRYELLVEVFPIFLPDTWLIFVSSYREQQKIK